MIIDGIKYSCEPCVRGHRQANCKHSDRPLQEIKRRGRPITACEECREARKQNNCHRSCKHCTIKSKSEIGDAFIKTLPNGAADLSAASIVRRSSSVRSRSSVSSAPSGVRPSVASTSASVASEEELATVGRKKSLSRPASSRRSSSAAQKKPHDLAHGHLADHPTHVSSTFSPYPHYSQKEHKERHVVPKVEEEETPSFGFGSANLALSPLPTFALPPPPAPARSYSAPTAVAAPQPQRIAPKPEPPQLSNEQLASAFFFRGFPSLPDYTPPSTTAKSTPALPAPAPTPAPAPAPIPPPAPRATAPVYPLPPIPPSEVVSSSMPLSTSPESACPPSFPVASYAPPSELQAPELQPAPLPYPADPAAEAFVLGPVESRPKVSLAPMYGAEASFYAEPAPVFSQDAGLLYSSYAPTTTGTPALTVASTMATHDTLAPYADEGTPLPPPNAAVYGYPLHPVESNVSYTSFASHNSSSAPLSVYSGYESTGAASAFERLDLNFDLDPFSHPNSAYHSSSASSVAGAVPQAAGADDAGPDLDGILEWLASSATAGVFPPTPSTAHSAVLSAPSAIGSDYGSSAIGRPPSSSVSSIGPSASGRTSAFSSSASSLRHSPLVPSPPPQHDLPISVAVDDAGYEEDDEAEEAEPANQARFGTVRPKRRDPNLEMMRTATITCFGQGDVSPEVQGEEDESSEDGEDRRAVSGNGAESWAADDPRHGFFARFGPSALDDAGEDHGHDEDEDAEFEEDEEDELERFGIDEEWLKRLGTQEVHLDLDDFGSGAARDAADAQAQAQGASSSSSSGSSEDGEGDEPPDPRPAGLFADDGGQQQGRDEAQGADLGLEWWN
ncbi:hypothetical protein JCM10207_001633 [Rhodosporidiobolus poonsookiae]